MACASIMTFIILANMLIQIVAKVYNVVADQKFLYVYQERV